MRQDEPDSDEYSDSEEELLTDEEKEEEVEEEDSEDDDSFEGDEDIEKYAKYIFTGNV